MFQPTFAFIGLRYARASKSSHFIAFINFFSVAGIALGMTALIVVSSVMNGFESQLKQRILGIVPHILVDSVGQAQTFNQQLLAIPHVLGAGLQIEAEGLIQGQRGLQGVMLQGVSPQPMQQYSAIAPNMLVGSLDELQEKRYRVVLGVSLARELGVQTGDEVRIMVAGATVYSPIGPIPSQRKFVVSGLFDLGSELDNKVVLLNIDDAARLLRQHREDIAQTRLFLDDAFNFATVIDQIEAVADVPTQSWRAREGALFDAVKMEKNMMALMLMLIVAVAAFNIVSALVMVVTEKRADIAILRTQGMTAADILRIFLTNGLYNGIKGTLLGLTGGLLMASQLNNITSMLGLILVPGGTELPVVVESQQILIIVGVSLALTFLATLYPAYRAANVAPASALRYE
ncbi:lipoprotein-releasing ABC transporter permease subunit [Neptunicella sp. SCSIO 80796]|uniref:lipoprotein-releasing ABC transporter permease subunit n=1 Tax=Neptunicella plasticusilytica TaxID=3117012 RepID=UPI003A4E12EF